MLDGDGHACYSFDLSNIDEIELLVKKIVSENGKLDGIVHCAGVAVARPLRQMKYQVIHELMLVNFYSYFELVRVFSKKCNNNGSGSIVVMSSVSARSGDKAQSAYAASKAAIEGSVNVLAKELADKNIRINAITAGMIKTRMFENFLNRYDENSIEQLYNKQYLGVIDKENIAYAVAYLLSDASKFITGTGLVIDGGYLT